MKTPRYIFFNQEARSKIVFLKEQNKELREVIIRQGHTITDQEKIIAGLYDEKLRDRDIPRQIVDRLYQSILATGCKFPGEIRDVFHLEMNRITEKNKA